MFNGSHEYAAKDRLKDGTAVIVRAIRASDKDLLQQLMKDVSAESRYFRFFCAKKLLTSQELKYFTEIDFDSHIGLIVSLCDDSETPIAVGRYITQTEDEGTGGAELRPRSSGSERDYPFLPTRHVLRATGLVAYGARLEVCCASRGGPQGCQARRRTR